jgi:hypothetical protein
MYCPRIGRMLLEQTAPETHERVAGQTNWRGANMHQTFTSKSRYLRAFVAAFALAAICVVALPALGQAASSKVVNTYNVKVAKGILAKGDVVKAKAVISNGAAQQQGWWNQQTIASVVRSGVNRGYGKAYISQGYRCTPVVNAWIGTFTCKFTGADVPTTIKLTFTADWRH